jgi:hypothetical protein
VDEVHEHTRKPTSPWTAVLTLAAVFVAVAFFGWQTLHTRQLTISSVSKPGEYTLICPRSSPSSRRIHVTGWIDGKATLEITGGLGPESIGPGNVDWKTGGDWYAGDCVLTYSPGTATTGKLTVEYRFD